MINVYFDKDGDFLTHLVKGNPKGFDVKEWMKLLYHSLKQDEKYIPQIDKVSKPEFPCIIVIHKSLFRCCELDLKEHRKTLEKILKLYSTLSTPEQTGGLWSVYKKYLDGELERVTKLQEVVCNHKNCLEQHLQQQCSFVNNSSIWIRLVDWKQSDISEAMNEMVYFRNIGLYEYGSAKENLEYNIRVQAHNYLESTEAGHGIYVTPTLYGNEETALEVLQDNKENLKSSNEGES